MLQGIEGVDFEYFQFVQMRAYCRTVGETNNEIMELIKNGRQRKWQS